MHWTKTKKGKAKLRQLAIDRAEMKRQREDDRVEAADLGAEDPEEVQEPEPPGALSLPINTKVRTLILAARELSENSLVLDLLDIALELA